MNAMANCQNKFVCPICGRETPEQFIEKHHLVPKSKKGKVTEDVCCNCGDICHKFLTINELEKIYNTVDKLKQHPKIKAWIKWVCKKPNDFGICMRSPKKRHKKKRLN